MLLAKRRWGRLASLAAVIVLTGFGIPANCLTAGEVRFPDDAGVINVKLPPYSAAGDGVTDDTAAIQKALDAYPSGNRIIYLPAGTYLVSDQLRWPPSADTQSKSGRAHKRTILQGEYRQATTIRLKDNCEGFQERTVVVRKNRTITSGRGVIWTGTAPAQRFRNAVRDLTIHTGSENPAACGLQFHANNQGTIRNVSVISGDRQGFRGFDFGFTGEIGPLLARNISVYGFDYGIYHAALNMVTMENVTVINQNVAGVFNSSVLPLRQFVSRANRRVFEHAGNSALVLLDADLASRGGDVFSVQPRQYYVRNAVADGFTHFFADDPSLIPGEELRSHDPVRLESKATSLIRLPVKESPEIPFETDILAWANPLDYGAVGDGKTDDTAAIQAAIDDPEKTTIYLPGGKRFRIEGVVRIRGRIERVIGCEGCITGNPKQPGRLVIEDGSDNPDTNGDEYDAAETVIIERIDCQYSGLTFSHETSRTVVLSSISGLGRIESSGDGDFFVDDVVCGPVVLTNSNQSIWMRQINTESHHEANLQNHGARLWVLGHKTENGHTKVWTTAGGKTEVYGAHIYANQKVSTPYPLFEVDNAEMTAVGIRQTFWPPKTKPFDILLREVRGTNTFDLTRETNPAKASLPYLISR